jgi:7-cyano-7-deazaguanine reductase
MCRTRARASRNWSAFTAPEFTSLCPVTGQPDFAHLVIDYAPGETIVESKSLKLFLGSFRNHCGFHEDVTVGIAERLTGRCSLCGCASAATGIRAAECRSTSSGKLPEPPAGLWVPDQGVSNYRGRG